MNHLENETLAEIQMQLWVAFGKGSGLLIDPKCWIIVLERRYLEKINKNRHLPGFIDSALNCAFEAGQLCAQYGFPDATTVSVENFVKALDHLELRAQRFIARNKIKPNDHAMGGICIA